jgi:predicted methyltransferase
MKPYYEHAGITIYHGDALHVLPELSEPFDAMVCDPPYSSGGAFRGDRMNITVAKYVQTGTIAYRAVDVCCGRDRRLRGLLRSVHRLETASSYNGRRSGGWLGLARGWCVG